jgi:hypothetical protein
MTLTRTLCTAFWSSWLFEHGACADKDHGQPGDEAEGRGEVLSIHTISWRQ